MQKQMVKSLGLTEIDFSNPIYSSIDSDGQRASLQRNITHAKFQLNRLLKNLPKGSVAYIAGGAPRDWHHGFGHRDIDIFYYCNGDPLTVYKPELGKTVECHLDIKGIRTSGEYYLNDSMQQYWDDTYYNKDGYIEIEGIGKDVLGPIDARYIKRVHSYNTKGRYSPIQLIEVDRNPLEVILDFPINMSKIIMEKSGKIYAFEDYMLGYEYKYIVELHRKQYNYSYLNKILGRYHEYAFIPFKHRKRMMPRMVA